MVAGANELQHFITIAAMVTVTVQFLFLFNFLWSLFKGKKAPNDNPWEALHKIRFGQPGVGMVALAVLDIEDQVDILAFTQHFWDSNRDSKLFNIFRLRF